jgi:tripartite ATP-independent transporter DctM subunit
MENDLQRSGVGPANRSGLTILRKLVESLSGFFEFVGGIALLAMMVLVVIDVVLRTVLKLPMPGTIELVELLLVIVLFSGMTAVELSHGHVRVTILIDKFSAKAKQVTIAAADFVAFGAVSIIAWQSFIHAIYLHSSNYQSGVMKVPIWPFAAATSVFMAIFALALLINIIESINQLSKRSRSGLYWLLPGLTIGLFMLAAIFWPEIMPFDLEPQSFGMISLTLLGVLIFFGVNIGAAMAIIAVWGMSYLIESNAGLSLIAMTTHSVASNYIWSVGPLFMLMGMLVAEAGFSRDVYRTAYAWLGHSPGGLASATISACGAFAAVVGDSLTGVVTMGTIGLPQMNKYKYDIKLATGAICAGGTIGILIPPSMGFIIYGIIVEESIGKLFIAGIVPGIILTSLMVALVHIRCLLNPHLGPRGPVTSTREKIISLKDGFGVVFLFLLVIGGIYSGIFTPNEAGAMGAFWALIMGLFMRRFTLNKFRGAVVGSIRLAAVVFFIFIYAIALSQFLAVTQLPVVLAEFVAGLTTPPYLTLGIILFTYLVLGCVMNDLPVVILTLPIIFPTVKALGFDPIWFGVLLVMMVEIGQITPPIGMSVFALSGIAKDVPMYTIFRGVLPFWLVMLFTVVIVILFPQLALFLPNIMMGN